MRELTVRIPQREEHHIFDPGLQVARTVRCDRGRALLEEEVEHRELVWPEAPQRIFVAANPSEVRTSRVNVAHVAQHLRPKQLSKPNDGWVEDHQMSDHQDPSATTCRSLDARCLLDGHCEGLL